MDDILFKQACDKIIGIQRERNGIGTLSEKTVHAVLKNFYEPETENQEIKIGTYVADIFKDGEIIEIQTGNFNVMRRKLDAFLPLYPVTIVYPIAHHKWLCWIDEDTGEITSRRKSPKTGHIYDAFFELYKIKSYLTNPNLHLCFPLIDMEEYRFLNGWSKNRKRGSSRHDRIPVGLFDEIYIDGPHEYGIMIPESLEETFTSRDYAKAAKLSVSMAQTALNVLSYVGAVDRVGKSGNRIIYARHHKISYSMKK